jgi:hypothetical protein
MIICQFFYKCWSINDNLSNFLINVGLIMIIRQIFTINVGLLMIICLFFINVGLLMIICQFFILCKAV